MRISRFNRPQAEDLGEDGASQDKQKTHKVVDVVERDCTVHKGKDIARRGVNHTEGNDHTAGEDKYTSVEEALAVMPLVKSMSMSK
jgi:hypothetical protein